MTVCFHIYTNVCACVCVHVCECVRSTTQPLQVNVSIMSTSQLPAEITLAPPCMCVCVRACVLDELGAEPQHAAALERHVLFLMRMEGLCESAVLFSLSSGKKLQ